MNIKDFLVGDAVAWTGRAGHVRGVVKKVGSKYLHVCAAYPSRGDIHRITPEVVQEAGRNWHSVGVPTVIGALVAVGG